MLLEVFEKLLASLIILAMLVLILFLAFPEVRRGAGDSARQDQEAAPRERFAERTPPREPPAGRTAPIESEEPAKQDEPAPDNREAVVPDPHSKLQPEPQPPVKDAEKAAKPDVQPEVTEAAKLQKRQDRLPISKTPEISAPAKAAKAKPRVRPETTIARKLPASTKDAGPDYVEERRGYFKRTQYRSRWDRTHYYECDGGRCDCSCDRPYYWAHSAPVCD